MPTHDEFRAYFKSLEPFDFGPPKSVLFSLGGTENLQVNLSIPPGPCSHAVIILDGDLVGPMGINIFRLMALGREIPPVAVATVGIGSRRYGDIHHARARHFTFDCVDLSMIGDVDTGGGNAFLEFIANEVTALLRKSVPALRVSPALIGCSLGGLFVLGAMLRQTGSFGGYAAISPALWVDVWNTSRSVAEFQPSKPVKLHLSVGELEVDDDSTGLATRMRESISSLSEEIEGSRNLDSECYIVPAAGHFSALPPALIHAARHLFSSADGE